MKKSLKMKNEKQIKIHLICKDTLGHTQTGFI